MATAIERRRSFDWNCNVVKFISALAVACEGAIQKVDPKQIPHLFAPIVTFASSWALIIIGGATLIGLIAEAIAKRYGRAWEWELIQFQLEELGDVVFAKAEFKDMGANRITLFRKKQFHLRLPSVSFSPRRWFRGWWAGWLVQVCRTGHVTQNKRTCFYAPDDSDDAEGVAGMAWRSRTAILVDKLPAVHGTSGEQKAQAYANQTWVSTDWIKKTLKKTQNPAATLPRSMFGMAVEGKKGRWGVLVIDSRQSTILPEEELIRLCTPICKNLANIVDRVC